MAGKVIVSRDKLVAVADAVRKKTGGTDALTLDAMPGAIAGIQGGGDVVFEGLPAGYGKCDYVQFLGEQLVDTGIVCTQATELQIVFTRERDSQHYMFGVTSSDNTASVTAYLGGSWRFGNKSAAKNVPASSDIVYTGILDSSRIMVTNNTSSISGVNAFETVGTLLLGGARNSNGTAGSPAFVGKVFVFELWSGPELALKLMPVVSFEGVYRFWDSVSGDFFDSITEVPLAGGNF